jgi:hypothetical protein
MGMRNLAVVPAAAIAADCELIGDAKLIEHDYLLKNGRKKNAHEWARLG